MKTILTLYSQPFPPRMLKVSENFYTYARKHGLVICRGFIADFDPQKNVFKKALFFEKRRWVWKNDIRPDFIHDRSLHYQREPFLALKKTIEKNFPFFNNIELSEIMTDKWLTYKTFRKFSPKLVLVKSPSDLKKIAALPGDRIILKPVTGSGGMGIKVVPKDDIGRMPYPFLAQEFIESNGYKNFTGGAHDLRVMVINEMPFHSFLRIPPKGKLLANLSQGGRIKLLDVKKLPQSLRAILAEVSEKLKRFNKKMYAVDFIFDKDGKPWIIELNSRPGIALEKEELPVKDAYYDSLINFYLNL